MPAPPWVSQQRQNHILLLIIEVISCVLSPQYNAGPHSFNFRTGSWVSRQRLIYQ